MGKQKKEDPMAMLEKFEKESMKFLADKYQTLLKELNHLKHPMKGIAREDVVMKGLSKKDVEESDKDAAKIKKLTDNLYLIQHYQKDVRNELAGLKRELTTTGSVDSNNVKICFNKLLGPAKEIRVSFKNDRSFLEKFVDFLKDLANCFIFFVTAGKNVQHFNTTTKPMDTIQRDIKEIKGSLVQFEKDAGKMEQKEVKTFDPKSSEFRSRLGELKPKQEQEGHHPKPK